jgi:hypothetical protein
MVEERLCSRIFGVYPSGRVFCGMPGIKMSVKMHYGDWLAVNLVQSSESRESDAVIASKGKELGLVKVAGRRRCRFG